MHLFYEFMHLIYAKSVKGECINKKKSLLILFFLPSRILIYANVLKFFKKQEYRPPLLNDII